MDKLKEYKVISHAFADGKGYIFKNGETVMLTEEEAAPFLEVDLEPVPAEEPETKG